MQTHRHRAATCIESDVDQSDKLLKPTWKCAYLRDTNSVDGFGEQSESVAYGAQRRTFVNDSPTERLKIGLKSSASGLRDFQIVENASDRRPRSAHFGKSVV